jgi:G3E family GTPase
VKHRASDTDALQLQMPMRTPINLITGPLGSGKTTLLRHILAAQPEKIAIVMNEFGEIAIDTKVIEGKNVRIAQLGGGCVCCSLLGEFEAAVNEIIEKIAPERIVVETTGLAEPEALVFNIQEALPQCRLDGVASVIDADMLIRFPELGHTTRLQIEDADILLLNKIDLIEPGQIEPLAAKLRQINSTAAMIRTAFQFRRRPLGTGVV